MKNIFTEHPRSLGETYIVHFKFASWFGVNMVMGGVACLTHAVFPFLFPKTGSDRLMKMMQFFAMRMPTSEERLQDLYMQLATKFNAAAPQIHSDAPVRLSEHV